MNFLPKQTIFIVGNEACERFGFYGMRSILVIFMTTALMMNESQAISTVHMFIALVYLTPLLGAWLADKMLGRYRTILYVSIIYCLGFFILATSDFFQDIETKKHILYSGLFVIGLGSGGIKPCVSAFMGDQIPAKDTKTMTRAYSAFYWSINLGSFFAFLIIPAVRDHYGWSWAFTIPGIFMALATFLLWCGRNQYHHIPPNKKREGSGFWEILFDSIRNGGFKNIETLHGASKVNDVKRVLRILSIFVFVIPFWALFDQTASSWVLQGKQMVPVDFSLGGNMISIGPEQLQAANPTFVMLLIPFLSIFIYPYIGRFGHPLIRMGSGIFLSAVAFVIVAWFQSRLDAGESMSIAWQLLPYLVLTVSEILLSTTGLEFAYTQAPANLKSIITSCWNLTIFLANLLVAGITAIYSFAFNGKTVISPEGFMFYAGMTAFVAILFAIAARSYVKNV